MKKLIYSTLVDGDITEVISNIININLTSYQSERGINMCEVIKNLLYEIDIKNKGIEELKAEIIAKEKEIEELKAEIVAKDKEIEELSKENASLREQLKAFQENSLNKK